VTVGLGEIIPHVLSVSNAEQIKIFRQRNTVRNLRVADSKETNQFASFVILQHSTGAVPARAKILPLAGRTSFTDIL